MQNNTKNDNKNLNTFAPAEGGTNPGSNNPSIEPGTSSDSKDPRSNSMGGSLGNLFEITRHIQSLELALLESGGEISAEVEHSFSSAIIAKEKKVDSYAAIIDRFKSIESEYRARADSLTKIARSAKALQERLKANLKDAMQFLETDEIQGVDTRFKLTEGKESVFVFNEDEVPIEYCDTQTVYIPNKDRILDAYRSGIKVPGTRIETVHQLRQYPARKGK